MSSEVSVEGMTAALDKWSGAESPFASPSASRSNSSPSWLSRNGLKAGIYVAAGLGAFLVIRGVIEFLS
jgi:hypothetical protein